MSSKAEEWASRRRTALERFRAVDGERPSKSPEVYASSGWFHFRVDDIGAAELVFGQTAYPIIGENIRHLCEQALWILDTFEEPKP